MIICFEIEVTFSRSFAAPVVTSWKTSSSAARPPSVIASWSISADFVVRYLSSVGSEIVRPSACPRETIVILHTDPVHKITIVSRGQALGLTISLPTEDKYLTTKSALMDQLEMTLGGRAAEELVFHEVTTGAANDIERVTSTSKQMIMRFGMSEKLGPRVLGHNRDMPFRGREMGAEPDYSEEIAREIDDEIRRVIEEAHGLAIKVLTEHMDDMHRLSGILIERETIDKDQFE